MNNNRKELLRQAFALPEPEKRDAFLATLRPRSISMTEFIFTQARYIQKSVWVIMLMILGVSALYVLRGSEQMERMVATILPFAAAVAVFETQRSYIYEMTEMEASTRFSLRSVVFAKMLILGLVAFGLIAIITPMIAFSKETSILMTGVRILPPYLLTMIVCLHIERMNVGRNNMYLSIAIAAAVSVSTFLLGDHVAFLLTGVSSLLLVMVTILLLVVTLLECRKTLNYAEAFV